jgi:trimethylamine--corrinoid protein Co-methyltransferase
MVLEYVAKAPSTFTMHSRDGNRDLSIGGWAINFAAVASAPNSSDIIGGRRDGRLSDFNDSLRLGQICNVIHMFGGYPVEPVDLPPDSRHLDCNYSFITLTDKIWHVYSLGHDRVEDALGMLCIARGRTMEQLAGEPSIFSVINTSSPLRVDLPMLNGLMRLAAAGQVTVVTPFTLSGAMSPVTIAGALLQQNAEALAVIAFTQMIRAGAPVIYGGFTSNVDMRSGAPACQTLWAALPLQQR